MIYKDGTELNYYHYSFESGSNKEIHERTLMCEESLNIVIEDLKSKHKGLIAVKSITKEEYDSITCRWCYNVAEYGYKEHIYCRECLIDFLVEEFIEARENEDLYVFESRLNEMKDLTTMKGVEKVELL
jgi:hypothetical protein